jgi:hypothetical protein
MTLNYINNCEIYVVNKIKCICDSYDNYYKDNHNTWIFIPCTTHILPVSRASIVNYSQYELTTWKYSSTTNTLSYPFLMNDNTKQHSHKYRLPWLSAKIISLPDVSLTRIMYKDMDDFLETFSIYLGQQPLTLYMVLYCWCIYSKCWVSSLENIQFQIIDDMGDDYTLLISDEIFKYPNCLVKCNK